MWLFLVVQSTGCKGHISSWVFILLNISSTKNTHIVLIQVIHRRHYWKQTGHSSNIARVFHSFKTSAINHSWSWQHWFTKTSHLPAKRSPYGHTSTGVIFDLCICCEYFYVTEQIIQIINQIKSFPQQHECCFFLSSVAFVYQTLAHN